MERPIQYSNAYGYVTEVNDIPSLETVCDAKANSIKEIPDYSSFEDEDDTPLKNLLVATAMDVWRANIAQYMSKLEIEMISAHGMPKGKARGFPPRSDDSFFAVLRYGKTMQKTLVAHSRTSDPVGAYPPWE
jgi:hypothetical protein